MKTPDQFTSRLHQEIPLSFAMGARIVTLSPQSVLLSAPLKPNINDKLTGFGGSINALATLACWTLVTAASEELGQKVDYLVIQDSSIRFLKPVTGDFEAEAIWPEAADRERFQSQLAKRKLARAAVSAVIRLNGGDETLATFTGRFVAQIIP